MDGRTRRAWLRAVGCTAVFFVAACGSEKLPEAPSSATSHPSEEGESAEGRPLETGGSEESDRSGSEANGGSNGEASPEAFDLAECRGLPFATGDSSGGPSELVALPLETEGSEPVLGPIDIDYEVTLTGTLSWETLNARSTRTLDLKASTDRALVRDEVEQAVEGQEGAITHGFPSEKRWTTLVNQASGSWADVRCALAPTVRVESDRGAGRVVSEYSPPLPATVVAGAAPERLAAELGPPGTSRRFSAIRANVLSSEIEDLPAGSTVTGSVVVKAIDPVLTATGSDGGEVRVEANRAFEITTDFGGAETTRALGLRQTVQVYVDTDQDRYAAVTLNSGLEGAPRVIFLRR